MAATGHDPQMLKGVLSVLLLHVVGQEDGYGYGIVTTLQHAGFADLAEGTVYPALTRLESAGLLQSYLSRSSSGPARKYYAITDSGRAELERTSAAWRRLVMAVDAVTGRSAAGPTTSHPANGTARGTTSTTTATPTGGTA